MHNDRDEVSATDPPAVSGTAASEHGVLFARQPIFDERQQVLGHELLYRGPRILSSAWGCIATARVLCAALGEIGLERIAPEEQLFINFDEALLVSGAAQILPPGRAVIEVLEDVTAGPAVLDRLAQLKRELGVRVALDDFAFQEHALGLLPLADFVKVDVLAQAERLEELVDRLRPLEVPLIAEKIETRDMQLRCRALGFRYFQGFFFAKPECMAGAPPLGAGQIALLQLLAELQGEEGSPEQIARVIGRDMHLVHQVLRLANSAHRRRRRVIGSIADAVVVLGRQTLLQWVSVLLLARLGRDKPSALLELALTRAALCERLSVLVQVEPTVGFTVGLMSLLDALLDRPMSTIVASLQLSRELSEALLGDRSGPLGQLLGRVIDFEHGRWMGWEADAPIDAGRVMEAYLAALELVRLTLHAGPA